MTGVFAVVDDDVWVFQAIVDEQTIHLGTVLIGDTDRQMQIMFLEAAIQTLTELKKGLMQ